MYLLFDTPENLFCTVNSNVTVELEISLYYYTYIVDFIHMIQKVVTDLVRRFGKLSLLFKALTSHSERDCYNYCFLFFIIIIVLS